MARLEFKKPKDALFNYRKADPMLEKETQKALNSITLAVQMNVRDEAPIGGTGLLHAGIKTSIATGHARVFSQEKYVQWVVGGRAPGTPPPVAPLLRWVKSSTKGRAFLAKLQSGGRKVSARSAAFVIARAIGKRGTKENPFFDRGIDASQATIQRIEKSLADRIERGLTS